MLSSIFCNFYLISWQCKLTCSHTWCFLHYFNYQIDNQGKMFFPMEKHAVYYMTTFEKFLKLQISYMTIWEMMGMGTIPAPSPLHTQTHNTFAVSHLFTSSLKFWEGVQNAGVILKLNFPHICHTRRNGRTSGFDKYYWLFKIVLEHLVGYSWWNSLNIMKNS